MTQTATVRYYRSEYDAEESGQSGWRILDWCETKREAMTRAREALGSEDGIEVCVVHRAEWDDGYVVCVRAS